MRDRISIFRWQTPPPRAANGQSRSLHRTESNIGPVAIRATPRVNFQTTLQSRAPAGLRPEMTVNARMRDRTNVSRRGHRERLRSAKCVRNGVNIGRVTTRNGSVQRTRRSQSLPI